MVCSLGNGDLHHSIGFKDPMQHLLGDGKINMVHSDTKNAVGEDFRGTRHFIERVAGRKKGWRSLCVDFVGFDTKLSCPRDGSTTNSAGYSDYNDLRGNLMRNIRESGGEEQRTQ
jgi:hypothetical protein